MQLARSSQRSVGRPARCGAYPIVLVSCRGRHVHFLIPTLPWAAAFALGAIISPPAVVATTAVLSRFKAIQFKSCNAMRVAPRWDYNSQHTTLE